MCPFRKYRFVKRFTFYCSFFTQMTEQSSRFAPAAERASLSALCERSVGGLGLDDINVHTVPQHTCSSAFASCRNAKKIWEKFSEFFSTWIQATRFEPPVKMMQIHWWHHQGRKSLAVCVSRVNIGLFPLMFAWKCVWKIINYWIIKLNHRFKNLTFYFLSRFLDDCLFFYNIPQDTMGKLIIQKTFLSDFYVIQNSFLSSFHIFRNRDAAQRNLPSAKSKQQT